MAENILPYLKEIDQNRYYTNFGPLVQRFENTISKHFDNAAVTTISNGTLGLTLALKSFDIPDGKFCLMPAWTFVATPSAAHWAGLTPYFLDAGENQILDPNRVWDFLSNPTQREKTGAVIVVSPFGAPIDIKIWEEISQKFSTPVIVDAAAGFDTARASSLVTMISLHATKVLGAGEGCIVLSTDAQQVEKIRELSVFGFHRGGRISHQMGTNAKMNEYNAAVALASLDAYAEDRKARQLQGQIYTKNLNSPFVFQQGFGTDWVSSTAHVCFMEASFNTDDLANHLNSNGVGTRKWWENGCHRHPAYAMCPKGDLIQTELLSRKTLGLPFFPDLTLESIREISCIINEAIDAL